jgi:hypothetical protein
MRVNLTGLATAASEETLPFLVRLLASGAVIVGRPSSSDDFRQVRVDAMTADLRTELGGTLHGREAFSTTAQEISKALTRVGKASGEIGDLDLLLTNASIGFPSGEALKLPALAVPVAGIQAWWLMQGEYEKAPRQWSMGFGALFPLDVGT